MALSNAEYAVRLVYHCNYAIVLSTCPNKLGQKSTGFLPVLIHHNQIFNIINRKILYLIMMEKACGLLAHLDMWMG